MVPHEMSGTLHEFLHVISDAVIVTDREGIVRLINGSAERLTRLKRAEAVGKSFGEVFRIVDEESRAPMEDPAGQTLRQGSATALPSRALLVAEDGTETPIAGSSTPIRSDQGEVTAIALVFRDRSAEGATQQALQERERRLRFALEGANDGLWDVLLKTGEVYISPRGCELLGCSPHEAGEIARAWSRLVHPDDMARTLERLNAHLEGRAGIFEVEQRLRTKSGEWKWVLTRGKVVERDSRGQPSRMTGTHTDISDRIRTEEALRLSEETYRQLFEAESDALFLIDNRSGQILEVNSAACALYGYAREEILAMKNSDLSAEPEDTRRVTAETVPDPGRVVTIPLRWHRKKDGTVFPVEITGRFFLRSGDSVHIAAIRDITGRMKAEADLRASEERLRLALRAANQGLYDLNVQTGEAEVSEEYARMLGYDPTEFRETNEAWVERLHPDDREPVAAVYRDYVAGRIPEYRVEFRQRTRSGDWKWILSLGKIMEWDKDGRPLRMLGTHTDISERKQAEEALRESEERFRLTFRTSPDSININRLEDGLYVDINEGFTRLSGYTRDDVIGKTSLAVDIWHDPADRQRLVQGLQRQGYYSGLEASFRRKDGSVVIGLMSARVITLHGAPHIISITKDITERKRMEREHERLHEQLLQLQKMDAIGQLAGGVAHDFNNMLQTILGYSELALRKIDPGGTLYENLTEIKKAAERSADLTRQLLAFARKQTISPKVLDLNETVSGTLKMLRRLIGEDIELIWKPGPNLWPIRIDPAQIDQVLANLAVNARDAIAGVGRLIIETENVVLDEAYRETHAGFLPGDYVLLAVSDSGSGMDGETLEHVFEPFFTTKALGKGTGLGLATVYGVIRQNNGFINVYSEVDQGTTFKIYLPRDRETAEPEALLGETKPPRGSETILFVEDDAAILRLGEAILNQLGYTVLPARTPGSALELTERHRGPIDLLITDVIMPEMNGKDLGHSISRLRPDIKILYMSGYTANIIAHHGVLEPGIQFLQKPFTVNTLATRVRAVLDT